MFRLTMNQSLLHGVKLSSAIAVISVSLRESHTRAYSLSASTNQDANVFDFIVIGAGSGGMACARRAASYGKKVRHYVADIVNYCMLSS
jgi:hypothetical protein